MRQRKFEYFGATDENAGKNTETSRPGSPKGDAEPLRVLDAHEGAVVALEFSRDGSVLCSVSHDGSVALWDTRSWTLRHRLHSISGSPVWTCHLSADATLLAMGCGDGSSYQAAVGVGKERENIFGDSREGESHITR